MNLKAFWKAYEPRDAGEIRVAYGKNTYVSVITLRGVDNLQPVVDAEAEEDTMPGREGAARAPEIDGEEGGIVLAAYIYDDPHGDITVTSDGFTMLLSAEAGSGDGMAIAVAPTSDSHVGPIEALGIDSQLGGGDDIGMTISFRAENHNDYLYPNPSPTTFNSVASEGTFKAMMNEKTAFHNEWPLTAEFRSGPRNLKRNYKVRRKAGVRKFYLQPCHPSMTDARTDTVSMIFFLYPCGTPGLGRFPNDARGIRSRSPNECAEIRAAELGVCESLCKRISRNHDSEHVAGCKWYTERSQ